MTTIVNGLWSKLVSMMTTRTELRKKGACCYSETKRSDGTSPGCLDRCCINVHIKKHECDRIICKALNISVCHLPSERSLNRSYRDREAHRVNVIPKPLESFQRALKLTRQIDMMPSIHPSCSPTWARCAAFFLVTGRRARDVSFPTSSCAFSSFGGLCPALHGDRHVLGMTLWSSGSKRLS